MPVVSVTVTNGDKPIPRPTGPDSIDVDQWDDVISFSSHIPLHAQLRDILLAHLRGDGYPLETLLPTQTRLIQRFSVGKITVRRAAASLIDNGYVTRVPGSNRLILHEAAARDHPAQPRCPQRGCVVSPAGRRGDSAP